MGTQVRRTIKTETGIWEASDYGIVFKPHPEVRAPAEYPIDWPRLSSDEDLTQWMAHLGGKTWIDKTDLVAVAELWAARRARRI